MTYQVLGVVGRGGMGVVEVLEDDAGRRVARKRVALHGSADDIDHARRRLRREAEVLASLHHPAIVPLLAFEDHDDEVVLVLPYLPGGTLADRIAGQGRLSTAAVVELSRWLGGALAAAHRAGIVHRDVKPENVLFDADGHPALTDFGVAADRRVTVGLTLPGHVPGTPRYMAPEQARGEPATAASDVWSLGATLLAAATGCQPDVASPRPRPRHPSLRSRPQPWPDAALASASPEVRRLVAPLLHPAPHRRPSAAAIAGGPDGTRVNMAPAQRARRQRRAAAGAAAVALTASAVVLLGPSGPGGQGRAAGAVGSGATSTRSMPAPAAPCTPLPYQPCGRPPAPFTDGIRCTLDHVDLDGDLGNGCEAAPDGLEGSVLESDHPLSATLVPADEVDTYRTYVADARQLACDGVLRITLTAPLGVADRLEVRDAVGRVLARTASADGAPATARIDEPSCGRDDSQWLTVVVSSVSGRSASSYRLVRSGSF